MHTSIVHKFIMAEVIEKDKVSQPGDDDDEKIDEEALQSRHRKEKKELQGFILLDLFALVHVNSMYDCLNFLTWTTIKIPAKVQALKKSASKGDKKKKKEVADEIAKLESEMETRHGAELKKHLAVSNKLINSFSES